MKKQITQNTQKVDLIFNDLFKKYFFSSMIYLVISIFFVYYFLFLFYSSPNPSVFIFFIILIIFGLFIIYFMKSLAIYTKNKKDMIKQSLKSNNDNLSFMTKIISLLEEFPYENRFSGKRKVIIRYLGWALLIYIFFVSIYIRVHLEFLSKNILLIYLVHGFGYYSFAFIGGTLIMYYFSGNKLTKVIKAGLLGFSIIIQIPTSVDYFLFGTSEALISHYRFIEWNDLLKSFNSFLLDPKIQSYACFIGHPIMFFFLLILVGMYVFMGNYTLKNNDKSELFISLIKTFLALVCTYIFLQITAVFEPMMEILLSQI
ncbi:MAG: hypothetical protein ACTSUG_06930, partial [Candidatus Helarchaeota archaeon]